VIQEVLQYLEIWDDMSYLGRNRSVTQVWLFAKSNMMNKLFPSPLSASSLLWNRQKLLQPCWKTFLCISGSFCLFSQFYFTFHYSHVLKANQKTAMGILMYGWDPEFLYIKASVQLSTNQASKVERSVWSHPSLMGTKQPLLPASVPAVPGPVAVSVST